MRRAGIVVVAALSIQSVQAQTVRTNEIANCSVIGDPTAQRICFEGAQQSRPASTFDPTAEKLKTERRAAPRRDALSPPEGKPQGDPGSARRAADPTVKRTDWRLQIP